MNNVQIAQRQWLIKSYLKTQTGYRKRSASVAEVQAHLAKHKINRSWKMVERDLKAIEGSTARVRRHPLNSTRWYYAED